MPRSIAREREAFARWRDAHATRRTSPTRERRDGRFERAADYLAHYLKRSRRRASEDYEAYCLCMCERARDERDAEEEFYYYGELVRANASEAARESSSIYG